MPLYQHAHLNQHYCPVIGRPVICYVTSFVMTSELHETKKKKVCLKCSLKTIVGIEGNVLLNMYFLFADTQYVFKFQLLQIQ